MSIDRGLNKEDVVYIYIYTYTKEYYSAIKRNEIMPFAATWADLEIIILSEVRQTKKNNIWYHLFVESKKKKLYFRKQTYVYQGGKVGVGGDKLRVWG